MTSFQNFRRNNFVSLQMVMTVTQTPAMATHVWIKCSRTYVSVSVTIPAATVRLLLTTVPTPPVRMVPHVKDQTQASHVCVWRDTGEYTVNFL